jgi:2-oxoglutarate dehydrogenase E1 component
MKDFSFVSNAHPAYIESMYREFTKDPESVDPEWSRFFEGFDYAAGRTNGEATAKTAGVSADQMAREFSVYRLIQAYRKKGHLIAQTNPIRPRKDRKANLDLRYYNLDESDLGKEFYAASFIGMEKATLQQILDFLKKCYTGSIGIEYSYIDDQDKHDWIQRQAESELMKPISLEQKKRILQKLNEGVVFEKFLHTKFIGQKRFSLEGGENTISGLDAIINTAADAGVQEVVIGMAHRGRLNVLANILQKTYAQIFNEFEGNVSDEDLTMGSGDVKYHVGFRSDIRTYDDKQVNIQLVPNPSHLELVDPVVVGYTRSKADVMYGSDYDKILPILVHGDSGIAAQGVVYEVLQMSGLRGYYTGGTIHFVINNQIGFTTDFDDARSSDYCTSLAAMVEAPVFHVNGDDAEAVVKVAEAAARYRQEFNSDIFIDMVCYRKHGHNEGDDPKYTQPRLYALIGKHPDPRQVYSQKLIDAGDVHADLAREMEKHFWETLQARLDEVKQHPLSLVYQKPELWWQKLRKSKPEDFDRSPDTAISPAQLDQVVNAVLTLPEDFKPLRKMIRLLEEKRKHFQEGYLDWSTGELAAYGSILLDGADVRMSGQDVKRGTFSHRHASPRDEETDAEYNRLSRISPDQGKFRIYNSLLSELAVVGFEYGYALANPNALVVWEAQFGDFANGAQTLIDQFVTSAEQKWNRMDGLVMLLPHGYEGQGPEHSSGRMERFLQMAAEYNMIITNCTTSASFFHVLRRQLAYPFRKPLINFSPKANLRHPRSYSPVSAFTSGGFREIIEDDYCEQDPRKVKKVLLCSGKIYFDLSEKQMQDQRKEIAILRLEQLYPLPAAQLSALYEKYRHANWFWVQEEPMNMGAAWYLKMNLEQYNIGIISRNASAAVATGYGRLHKEEQNEIIETAFSILNQAG